MKKTNWTSEQEAEINRIQRTTGVTRKSAIRKIRAAAKVQAKAAAKVGTTTSLRTVPPKQAQKSIPGISRAAGLALYRIAGRPKKQDFPSCLWLNGRTLDLGATCQGGRASHSRDGRYTVSGNAEETCGVLPGRGDARGQAEGRLASRSG